MREFQNLLRTHARGQRGDPIVRKGRSSDDQAAIALRVVRLTPGSAVLEIADVEPETPAGERLTTVPGVGLANLTSLIDGISGASLAPETVAQLESVRRSMGPAGSIEFADRRTGRMTTRARVDRQLIERMAPTPTLVEDRAVRAVGGLRAIDLDQHLLAVRSVHGVEWRCRYDVELHDLILTLIDGVVEVRGVGREVGPRRGELRISSIQEIDEASQLALFSDEVVATSTLLEASGITAPQGFAALISSVWDDESDDDVIAFLRDAGVSIPA